MKKFLKSAINLPLIGPLLSKILEKRREYLILKGPQNLKSYDYLAVYLTQKDRENARGNRKMKALHRDLDRLRKQQVESWDSFVYCKGYYYQGYQRIGIQGIKPTEARMEGYDVYDLFKPEGKVLDIGSNSGFLSIYLSDYFEKVVGIELNPHLINMGECVKEHLGISNVEFSLGDFITYRFEEKFDAVFSLSNHFTIDGNLNVGFEDYILKIHNVLNDNGIMFFESHNINGDDKDLDEKFRVASKYFELKKYKMVKAFYPADIDKLFAVFVKIDSSKSSNSNFSLEKAKTQYSYQ